MAKTSDHRAGSFDTENTDGVLSGLLAEEEQLDRRAMFRLGTWGVASVGAVVIAVLANQSALKMRRDNVAALDLTRQSQQIQSVARESQNETRRLASAIDTLNGDRDRLYSRLTSLEQGLDSVTGAIAKQNTAAAPTSASPPPAMTLTTPAPTQQPVTQTTAPEPAQAVAPVVTATPAPEKPRAEAKKPSPLANATLAVAPPVSAAPSSPSATPLIVSKSLMAPPDAAAAKLMEPEPSANAIAVMPPPSPQAPASTLLPAPEETPAETASAEVANAEPVAAPLAVKRTQFGVDVGGANSVGGLRALWRGLLKSRSNAALTGLQPIIVVKEPNNGLGMQLRLVAGPLGDAAAAARICAGIAANNRPCETTVFDGQRLTLNANDLPTPKQAMSARQPEAKPSEAKPSPEADSEDKSGASKPEGIKPGSEKFSRRRGNSPAKRAAVEEPPKKPETSSGISSFFNSRVRSQ